MKAKVPCKDCQDRKVGCHSVCEKYKEFEKENAKVRDMRLKASILREYDSLTNYRI